MGEKKEGKKADLLLTKTKGEKSLKSLPPIGAIGPARKADAEEKDVLKSDDSEYKSESFITKKSFIDVVNEEEDWNIRFQCAIQKLRGAQADMSLLERAAGNVQLLHLSQDFVHAAATYGKIIIAEMNLPIEKKTLKPVYIGGRAGTCDINSYPSAFFSIRIKLP